MFGGVDALVFSFELGGLFALGEKFGFENFIFLFEFFDELFIFA